MTSNSRTYAAVLLGYELLLLAILNVLHITPISSQHINIFLKIFIPTIMLGELILLRSLTRKRESIRRDMTEVTLTVYGIVAFAIGSCVSHIITVLLGASLIDVVEETCLFSCLFSALTVFPLYIVYETRWEEFLDNLPESLDVRNNLRDGVQLVSYFTMVGAWLGAFPIPLDWGRDWQTWPITCCVGALGGNLIGLLAVIFTCGGLVDRIAFWKWKTT